MIRRFAPWVAVGLACLVLLTAIGLWSRAQGPSASGAGTVGGPFQLMDQTGRPVDQSLLNGKWSAVYFGYTYCPDVCPTTLTTLGGAIDRMGARAKDFQIVFGVRDPDDPAVEVVRRLQREFPALDLALAVNPALHGTSRKVSNLINMMPLARHETLVSADSDIRVARDYLRRVVAPLVDLRVGVVTCA